MSIKSCREGGSLAKSIDVFSDVFADEADRISFVYTGSIKLELAAKNVSIERG